MEPNEAARVEGSDRFARAAVLAERFLDNIETVVHGKREEIKLKRCSRLHLAWPRILPMMQLH